MDCASESFINIVYMLTGFDASPRAMAKMSNTTMNGNTEGVIASTAQQLGIIPYTLWPSPDYFDWATYYDPVPQNALDAAVKLSVQFVPANLNVSPLWTCLRFPNGALHLVAQINQTQYFDSEMGSPIKDLTYGNAVVVSQTSLKITINNMELINDNGTIYLKGPTGKIGIADPIALAKLKSVDSQIQTGSTAGIPQVGVFKSVNIDQNTTLSVLVDN